MLIKKTDKIHLYLNIIALETQDAYKGCFGESNLYVQKQAVAPNLVLVYNNLGVRINCI